MFRMLIVDDEPMALISTAHSFDWRAFGFDAPATASSGEEALQMLTRERFDAALVDIRMPGLSGLELVEACRERGLGTCFAVLSGYSDFSYVQSALRLNAVDYCLKPVEPEESQRVLANLLKCVLEKRLSEDAKVNLLEEAVQTSYRKAGEETCSNEDSVTKETVKDLLHELEFPEETMAEEKKVVPYLYIDADEDHISLQFRENKGDLQKGENGYKENTEIGKLIYVYEGIEKEAPKSTRHRLINPHYFSGVYRAEKNRELWEEVWRYIDSHYDVNRLKRVYVNGDGAAWIKASKNHLEKVVHVLDEHHLDKYINRMTAHMKDSREDASEEAKRIIREEKKADFKAYSERLREYTDEEARLERIGESERYLLSNWGAAKLRLSERRTVIGCSAEGHVSHVLSSRMSSRPMGWSTRGTDAMCHLRAYYANGRSLLELIRYHEKPKRREKTTEAEKILSSHAILVSERNRNGVLGKYMETMKAEISKQISEKVYFHEHIRL